MGAWILRAVRVRPDEAGRLLMPLVLAGPFDPAHAAKASIRPFRHPQTGPVVLSWERLAGSPHSGGVDRERLAERLHAVVPRARVLITIREQRRALRLAYEGYVAAGGAASLEGYVSPYRTYPVYPVFDFEFFEYHRLIQRYRRLFGDDRVEVVVVERLVETPDAEIDRVARILGIETASLLPPPPWSRIAAGTIARRRWTNSLFVRGALHQAPPIPLRRTRAPDDLGRSPRSHGRDRLDDAIDLLVDDRFADSNRLTADLVGVDLGAAGYAA